MSVNGKVVRSGASKFPVDAMIEVDGVGTQETPLLAIYHKPVGVLSTMKDEWNRECLKDIHVMYPWMKNMHPVGRLDAGASLCTL